MSKRKIPWKLKLLSLWPPLLGAGIRVKMAKDMSSFTATMKQRAWNTNINGSHYGGSIFSMTDPFYALILIAQLGRDYLVWDKAADINFKKPGKGKLTAHFNITAERVEEIRREVDAKGRARPVFVAEVKDKTGAIVATVRKTLHVSKKKDLSP